MIKQSRERFIFRSLKRETYIQLLMLQIDLKIVWECNEDLKTCNPSRIHHIISSKLYNNYK